MIDEASIVTKKKELMHDNRNFFADVSSSSGRKPFSVVIKKLNVYFGHPFFSAWKSTRRREIR